MQRVRLHQNAFQLDCLQQLPQCLGFTACISGVGGLGNRDAQALGIEADLGNECRCARVGFSDGATQRLAVTHQRLESLRTMAINSLRLNGIWSVTEGIAALAHDIKGLLRLLGWREPAEPQSSG